MLPTFVNKRVTGAETGDFYALDLGAAADPYPSPNPSSSPSPSPSPSPDSSPNPSPHPTQEGVVQANRAARAKQQAVVSSK